MIRKVVFNVILILCSLSFMLIVGEIAIRDYLFFHYDYRGNSPQSIYVDDKDGWRATELFTFQGYRKDAAGIAYLVKIKTDFHGFRMFGNVNTKHRKVFVIGDSFTHALEVSNDKTYYSFLSGNILPIEVFAYGGGGFGTLQEYMIVDEYVDLIRPDLIVLQYCSNDFINNSYQLEVNSYLNNNGMRRPYLNEAGKIVYLLPRDFAVIRELGNRYSKLFYFLISRVDRMNARWDATVERDIEREGQNHAGFKQAVAITDQLIGMIRSRIPQTVGIVAFSADNKQPYYEEFKRISRSNGIGFVDGVAEAISVAEARGLVTRSLDGIHWNELGHKIAGEHLLKYFKAEWKNVFKDG